VKSPGNCRNVRAKFLSSCESHAHEIPAPPVIRHADLEVEHGETAPPLDGLCYREVRRALSVERRGQLLEERGTKCRLRGCNLHLRSWVDLQTFSEFAKQR
jgi:hypothetical protein